MPTRLIMDLTIISVRRIIFRQSETWSCPVFGDLPGGIFLGGLIQDWIPISFDDGNLHHHPHPAHQLL